MRETNTEIADYMEKGINTEGFTENPYIFLFATENKNQGCALDAYQIGKAGGIQQALDTMPDFPQLPDNDNLRASINVAHFCKAVKTKNIIQILRKTETAEQAIEILDNLPRGVVTY